MQDVDRNLDRTELEYQTAQESAHHHDQLIWTTAGIVWGASLVLLGFVLSGLAEESGRVVRTAIASFGLILICVVWRFMLVWRAVRNRKYEVCWSIEELPGFQQKHHSREKRDYPRGTMTKWYGVVSVLFIGVWLMVIIGLWCPALR